MATYRGVLRYREAFSGLTWVVTAWRDEDTPDTFKAAADAWNDAYLGTCFNTVQLVDFSVSHPAVWGDVAVYNASEFETPVGTLAVKLMPLAEYIQVRLEGTDVNRGRSLYKLHGTDMSMIANDGQVEESAVLIIALVDASLLYFMQWRLAPTAHYPAVTPPQFFASCVVNGPYVRRLGNPFSSPGQRARYTRSA